MAPLPQGVQSQLSFDPNHPAYPMVSIGYVVNAVIAWAWPGESLSLIKVVGIGIIILGVLVLARA